MLDSLADSLYARLMQLSITSALSTASDQHRQSVRQGLEVKSNSRVLVYLPLIESTVLPFILSRSVKRRQTHTHARKGQIYEERQAHCKVEETWTTFVHSAHLRERASALIALTTHQTM